MTSKKKLKRRIRQLEKELAKAYLEQAPPVSVPESTRPYTYTFRSIPTKMMWGWSDNLPNQDWLNSLRVDDDGRMTWTTEEGIAGEG